ncbi:MAG: RND family efflux transporter, MFP subunit [Candidatus Magasanikbacteria bacterium GW2011_GWE2_42_7]|uniref:RND family efflux transporter, MFP subunit n=1 Tax=Candidatus Magasanikbacteria bacterium GW2011_GWE2_42_7 TaxID=1619052 RepID=A0A0G1DML4_9BACT|nr:MAG: RND family efflux transporter, MFP subunit [Candidatus Magasanikbacteria bacterium GW2011_GWE2_42_7]
MLATAEETASAALLVPLSAVKITAQSHSVFVVEDGHTVSVSIETGNLIGDKIEILSGIDGYDAIVSSVRGIEEGDAVSILE